MIKSYSVFVRTNTDGNQHDDMNVVGQHHKTYAGIVRGDSMDRAIVNAVQKTGRPAPFLLIYEGEVAVGENAAHCPCCGENLGNIPEGLRGSDQQMLDWVMKPLQDKLEELRVFTYGSDGYTYRCPHCHGSFNGAVETVTRTMFFQVTGE